MTTTLKIEETILVNMTATSNKFWAIKLEPVGSYANICTRWGRVGTTGQSQVKQDTQTQAEYSMRNLVNEKKRKGYKEISEATYKEMSIRAQIVGTRNKCDLINWVEVLDFKKGQLRFIASDKVAAEVANPAFKAGLVIVLSLADPVEVSGRSVTNVVYLYDLENLHFFFVYGPLGISYSSKSTSWSKQTDQFAWAEANEVNYLIRNAFGGQPKVTQANFHSDWMTECDNKVINAFNQKVFEALATFLS